MPGTLPFGAGAFGQEFGQQALPTVTSATINPDGTLSIHFSTAVFPGMGAILFTLNGTNSVITNLSIAGNVGLAELIPQVLETAVVTMNYTQGNIHDGSGNFMLSFTDFPVTNNSDLLAEMIGNILTVPRVGGIVYSASEMAGRLMLVQ